MAERDVLMNRLMFPLLLVATARSGNTGMKWNQERTSLTEWGTEPTVIEPVTGHIVLKDLAPARRIEVLPLGGGAKAIGEPIQAELIDGGHRIPIGRPAVPWYLIRITR